MSRVGRKPIEVPSGVRVSVAGDVFTAEGPKGKVSQALLPGFPVEIQGGKITVGRPGDAGPDRAKHGLIRALLANAVEGVSQGYSRGLEIIGVGYKAEVRGSEVHFALGYSHPVVFKIPAYLLPGPGAVYRSQTLNFHAPVRIGDVVTVHHGHMPEVTVTSATTATGVWAFEDRLWWPEGAPLRRLHGFGHYHETYVKTDQGWRIASLRISRLHRWVDR